MGNNLGPMMQKIHGSTAKLVNDLLPERRMPFYRDADHHDYFDGCLRDVLQTKRTYRYIHDQSGQHKVGTHHKLYPHTRIDIEYPRAINRVVQLKAFLEEVPYARYNQQRRLSASD